MTKKKPEPAAERRTISIPGPLAKRLEDVRAEMVENNDGVDTPFGKLVERAIEAWIEGREAT